MVSSVARAMLISAIVGGAAAISGCAATDGAASAARTSAEFFPARPAGQTQVAGAAVAPRSQPTAQPVRAAPVVTGIYPNLNIRPTAAAPQFTNEERDAKIAQLSARRSSASARRASPTNANDLRSVGAVHGENALKAISQQSAD